MSCCVAALGLGGGLAATAGSKSLFLVMSIHSFWGENCGEGKALLDEGLFKRQAGERQNRQKAEPHQREASAASCALVRTTPSPPSASAIPKSTSNCSRSSIDRK